MKKIKLVLLRHGKSAWNKNKRFTGWTDIPLAKEGVEETEAAAKILKKKGFTFDLAFTSVLKRGIQTLEIVLEQMGLESIPIFYSWRLNEKHYGALQGLSKPRMAKKYGEKQVHLWRRSYHVRPPALKNSQQIHAQLALKDKMLDKKDIPLTESLKDVEKRLLPYWHKSIIPKLKEGKKVLISAHSNSLRALVKYLDKIPGKEIDQLNIPTGIPLVYEFDSHLRPIKHYYLCSSAKLKEEMKFEKSQGKIKFL